MVILKTISDGSPQDITTFSCADAGAFEDDEKIKPTLVRGRLFVLYARWRAIIAVYIAQHPSDVYTPRILGHCRTHYPGE